MQFVSYERQLRLKDEILQDSLTRLGGIETPLLPVLSDSQWQYRHRAQFKVTRNGDIGFYRQSSMDVVTFEQCPLMNTEINRLLTEIKRRTVMERLKEIHLTVGDTALALLKGSDFESNALHAFNEVGFSGIAYNDTLVSGEGFTGFTLDSLTYTVSPWSFFQSHWALNRKVVDYVISHLMPLEGKKVLDLYAGAGNFSIPIAAVAKEVVGVEENHYAVEDGARNLKINKIRNCRFKKTSAEKYKVDSKFDVVILDPPRPGLTSVVLKKLLEARPELVVYISCNPATLARDLKKMSETYAVQAVRQVDFFPNTFHIEAIVFLHLR